MGKKKNKQTKQKKKGTPKVQKKQPKQWKLPRLCLSFLLLPLSFFYIELFAWGFLGEGSRWPLAFGGLWAVAISCLLRLLPQKA